MPSPKSKAPKAKLPKATVFYTDAHGPLMPRYLTRARINSDDIYVLVLPCDSAKQVKNLARFFNMSAEQKSAYIMEIMCEHSDDDGLILVDEGISAFLDALLHGKCLSLQSIPKKGGRGK